MKSYNEILKIYRKSFGFLKGCVLMRLELNGVCKSFGEKQVLRNISFCAESGQAYGLLGRNGAGKTTTIRIIMNVFPPDGGSVTVDGKPLHASDIRLGYMPEERGMYAKKRIDEQLVFFGRLKGLSRREAYESAKKWVDRFELSDYFEKRLMTLSKGNQQKIQLAATLINDPDIIILDEPFSGLDPVNARVLKDVIKEKIGEGKIVLFSSHQMNYIEEFCEELAFLRDGGIVLQGNLRQIKTQRSNRRITVRSKLAADVSKLLLNDSRFSILNAERNGDELTLELADISKKEDILRALLAVKIPIEAFAVRVPSLEEIFVEVTGK